MKSSVICKESRGSYKWSLEELNDLTYMPGNSERLNSESMYSFSSYFYYEGMTSEPIAQLWDMRTGELVAWNRGEPVENTFTWIHGFRYVFPSGNEFRKSYFDYLNQNCGVFIRQADECVDDVPGLTADDNPVLIVLEF